MSAPAAEPEVDARCRTGGGTLLWLRPLSRSRSRSLSRSLSRSELAAAGVGSVVGGFVGWWILPLLCECEVCTAKGRESMTCDQGGSVRTTYVLLSRSRCLWIAVWPWRGFFSSTANASALQESSKDRGLVLIEYFSEISHGISQKQSAAKRKIIR